MAWVDTSKRKAAEEPNGEGSKMFTQAPTTVVSRSSGLRNSFKDSTVFSDVTVYYGTSGELKFEGHRVILSAASKWFEEAFVGDSKEAGAKTIRLYDDEPSAIKAMIEFLYLEHIDPPVRVHPSATNILFSIELYRIVGKYSVPVLGSTALSMFEGQSGHWLHASREISPPGHELPTSGGFCKIIERVYKLPNADPTHPIMSYILALNY